MTNLNGVAGRQRLWLAMRRILRRQFAGLAGRLLDYAQPDFQEIPGLWRRYGATIGVNVDIDPSCFLDRGFASLLRIDDNVVIAMGTAIILHDSSVNNVMGGPLRVGRVHICRGAYIGACSILLPGITVGEGAIVGAGSLVASDIGAGVVAVGRPARATGSTTDLAARFAARSEAPGQAERFFSFPSQAAQADLTLDDIRRLFLSLRRQVDRWV